VKTATVQISAIPTLAGHHINNASVTSTESDVNPVNDSYSLTVKANAPVVTADLGVTMTDSPDPVKRLAKPTYAINVNNSASVATRVK